MAGNRYTAQSIQNQDIVAPTLPSAPIIVEETVTRDGFQPTAVRFPEAGRPGPASTALMPGRNLLPLLDVRAFGVEERVEVHSYEKGLRVRCHPGSQPAGLVLGTGPSHFPRGTRMNLIIRGEASSGVGISVVEAEADAPAEPMAMLQPGQTRLALPPRPWSEVPHAQDVVLSCPKNAAVATIESIVIAPDRLTQPTTTAGTWIWRPDFWIELPEAVSDLALKANLDRVYLQLRIVDRAVAKATLLAELVEHLGRHGIAAYAVEGDPAMATREGREHALTRVAAIVRYQADAPPGARLAGIQFDIEPYLLEAYAHHAADLWRGWTESIKALSQGWGAPVSVAVPFWMLGESAGLTALDTSHRMIAQAVVMAYRTKAEDVFPLAEPWLAWGAARGVPIAIALENGLPPVESPRASTRGAAGKLIPSSGDGGAQVMLHSDNIGAPDDGLACPLNHETRADPSRISFMGNHRQLSVVRSQLLRLLSAWSSFDGVMLHELGDPEREAREPVHSVGGNR